MIRVLRMRRSCQEVPGVQQAVPRNGCWEENEVSLEQQEAAAVWQPAQAETAGISPSLKMLLWKCDRKHLVEQPNPQLQ